MALAASTNSWSLIEITDALTILAYPGTEDILIASIRLNKFGPNAETIAIANKILGTARKTSIILMITLSNLPP